MKYLLAKFKHAPWWTKLSIILLIAILTTLWYGTYIYTGYQREQTALKNMGVYHERSNPSYSLWRDIKYKWQQYHLRVTDCTLHVMPPSPYLRNYHMTLYTPTEIHADMNPNKIKISLSKLSSLKQLTTLTIEMQNIKNNNYLTTISQLNNIESLILYAQSLTDEEFKTVCQLPNLKNATLKITFCNAQQIQRLKSINDHFKHERFFNYHLITFKRSP